jgi:hypothetical protein
MFESFVNYHVCSELHHRENRDGIWDHVRTQQARDTAVTAYQAVCLQADTLLLGIQNQILNQLQTHIGEILAD